MPPDRVEKGVPGGDSGAMLRALEQHAQTLASGAVATAGRGLQAASKAAPEIIDGATARMAGLASVVLSMPGDVPHDAVHGYGHPVSSSATTADEANLHAQRYPHAPTTSEGAHALVDVKSNCDPNDFQAHGSHDALKKAMDVLPGEAMHHLVEQGGNNTARFGTAAIQNTRNVVKLPQSLHAKISGFYNSKAADQNLKNADGSAAEGKVRDYVQKLPYDEQRKFGIDTTRRFARADTSLSSDDKAKLLKQLDNLEGKPPATCLPEAK